MSENAMSISYNIRPPNVSGPNQVINTATAAAAASYDWVTALSTDAPKGNCFLLLEAITQDVYVRFGPTATTATTANNGLIIKAGQPGRIFYVSPVSHKFIDHLGLGVGVLKVQVQSPIGERVTQ